MTVKERRKFLKDKGLCFHCRRNFHGVRKPNDSRTTKSGCNWTREMEPVKCHPQQGRRYSTSAMCICHADQSNVLDDLRTWLTNLNMKNTLCTMYSLQCRSCSGPCDTDVSKEDRAKLQKGQIARDFSDE